MINNCDLNKELYVNIAFYILQKYPNRDPKRGGILQGAGAGRAARAAAAGLC